MPVIRRTSQLFTLTGWNYCNVFRSDGLGHWDDVTGKWVPSIYDLQVMKLNVQPTKFSQTIMMDAADRTKEWIDVWSSEPLRKAKEGVDGWDADIIVYNDRRYKVMYLRVWQTGVIDHFHARACLDSPTPRGQP